MESNKKINEKNKKQEKADNRKEENKEVNDVRYWDFFENNSKSILVFVCVFVCFIIGGILAWHVLFDEVDNDNIQNKTTISETVYSDEKTISSGELKAYFIDKLNNTEVKIAQTKLDDKVAYSLTYNNDEIPQGKLNNTMSFAEQCTNVVLINGYPYLSYEQMGLQSDEEAYLATQLAIYEVVSRRQYIDLSNR